MSKPLALRIVAALVLLPLVACACASTKTTLPATISTTSTSSSVVPTAVGSAVSPQRVPLGDGKVSTSPQRGYVFACQTRFVGGGAFRDGPWIKSDGTWDSTAKALVDGEVAWPSRFAIREKGGRRIIESAGLPDHPTGAFPISPEDDAFQYDRNPNRIAPQTLSYDLPLQPVAATQPSCLPMGQIGVLLTGSVFFNALDAQGKDAVAHEIQDRCHGHPENTSVYHYHNITPCLTLGGSGHSALAGYAFDGYGIYGPKGADDRVLTNADLDDCHGHTHELEIAGRQVSVYHYHATLEYPYTLGCFHGTPVVQQGPPRAQ